MLEKINGHLEQARTSMLSLADKIEASAHGFAEETHSHWQQSKAKLVTVNEQLDDAILKLQSSTDEAKLQGHLAVMNAHDQWQYLQHNLTTFSRQVEAKAQPVIDHAALQSELAKMDARDFMAQHSKQIVDQYAISKTTVEQATLKAAGDIKQCCDGLIAGLPK